MKPMPKTILAFVAGIAVSCSALLGGELMENSKDITVKNAGKVIGFMDASLGVATFVLLNKKKKDNSRLEI